MFLLPVPFAQDTKSASHLLSNPPFICKLCFAKFANKSSFGQALPRLTAHEYLPVRKICKPSLQIFPGKYLASGGGILYMPVKDRRYNTLGGPGLKTVRPAVEPYNFYAKR